VSKQSRKQQSGFLVRNKNCILVAFSFFIIPFTMTLTGCRESKGQAATAATVTLLREPVVATLEISNKDEEIRQEVITVLLPSNEKKLGKKLTAWLLENDFDNVSADVLDCVKPSQTTIYYLPESKETALRIAELLSVREVREWNAGAPVFTVSVIPGDDFDDINLFANPALAAGDMSVLHESSAPLDDPVAPSNNTKPDGIYISLGRCALSLYAGGELKGTWQCAVGLPSRPTPKGKFRVVSMLKNPDWSWQGRSIPPGPKNGLGTRFLGISKPSYGIHGTNDPESIGKALSHGCVRMHNRDVEALYDMVEIGTPVMIGD
jgi:hypothetical protein